MKVVVTLIICTLLLTSIGNINLGFMGLFHYDFLTAMLGKIARPVFALIGLSGVFLLFLSIFIDYVVMLDAKYKKRKVVQFSLIPLFISTIFSMNWAFIGFFEYNLLGHALGGEEFLLARIAFVFTGLVGLWSLLAGVYCLLVIERKSIS